MAYAPKLFLQAWTALPEASQCASTRNRIK
nr:MAG TPA: hypothetical protein [Caudoviricetes sp.]DAK67848.1 MAG TPA: hypothetical protein [Caudoviricetes sp.]